MADAPEKCPTGHDLYESCLSGAQDRPFIPRLRSDPPPFHPLPHSLLEFRQQEGKEERERRLQELWRRLPNSSYHGSDIAGSRKFPSGERLTVHKAEEMRRVYEDELLRKCGGHTMNEQPNHIRWPEFRRYAEAKEAGKWIILYARHTFETTDQSCGLSFTMNWTLMAMAISMRRN
jgi:solute carrier family 25 (mitochondrial phosphate transporter), member 23/24/25/41